MPNGRRQSFGCSCLQAVGRGQYLPRLVTNHNIRHLASCHVLQLHFIVSHLHLHRHRHTVIHPVSRCRRREAHPLALLRRKASLGTTSGGTPIAANGLDARRKTLENCKSAGCRMVQYCCKEHQKEDWKAHKQECRLFQVLELRATFYSDSDMLARYPLAPHPRFGRSGNSEPAAIPRGSRCGLCLIPDSEESMTRTNCCGNILCDTSHRYQLMSYSREFCERSHDRYTLCGYHGVEEECNKAVDWRECEKCAGRGPAEDLAADRLWRGLNAYNFCPLLSKDVPRHGLCDVCDRCKQKFVSGVQGCGFGAGGKIVCLDCSYQGIGE